MFVFPIQYGIEKELKKTLHLPIPFGHLLVFPIQCGIEKELKKTPFAWLFIEAKVTEALLEASIWDFERKVVEASSSFPIVAYL